MINDGNHYNETTWGVQCVLQVKVAQRVVLEVIQLSWKTVTAPHITRSGRL